MVIVPATRLSQYLRTVDPNRKPIVMNTNAQMAPDILISKTRLAAENGCCHEKSQEKWCDNCLEKLKLVFLNLNTNVHNTAHAGSTTPLPMLMYSRRMPEFPRDESN